MKTSRLLLSLLLTGLLFSGQRVQSCSRSVSSDAAKNTILSFLQHVYETQDEALKIAHHYIRLESSPNEFSVDKRYEVAAAHITLLRKGEALSVASPPLSQEDLAGLRVERYNDLLSRTDVSLVRFGLDDSQREHLYVVLNKGAAWKYFYLKGHKIIAFDYLSKGKNDPSFLFSY